MSRSTEMVDRITFAEVNLQLGLVTNQVPQVTSVLAWPSDATDFWLEYSDRRSVTTSWHFGPEASTSSKGLNLLTNVSLDPQRLFRLRRL